MDFFLYNKKSKKVPRKLFLQKNNLLNKIEQSQDSISSYIQKLNLAGFNNDFDSNEYLKRQQNSDRDKDSNSYHTSKASRRFSMFSSFRNRRNTINCIFSKPNKLTASPKRHRQYIKNPISLTLKNNSIPKKHSILIPNSYKNRKSSLFLTITDNYEHLNYSSRQNNFISIPEQNNDISNKQVDSNFTTQSDFFKSKKNLRPKTMTNFFEKVDLFDLKKAKKKQKKKESENKKLDIQKKYPKETFDKLIDNFKEYHKKTISLSKRMLQNIEGNKPLIFMNEKIKKMKKETEDIVDMNQLQKQRNSEKIPKMGSIGQINMVNRANSNLMDFGDDYLKLDDIDFYKRAKYIMKKYQEFRINAEVKEKPVDCKIIERHNTLNKNNFIIKKKIDALERETIKLIGIKKKL